MRKLKEGRNGKSFETWQVGLLLIFYMSLFFGTYQVVDSGGMLSGRVEELPVILGK